MNSQKKDKFLNHEEAENSKYIILKILKIILLIIFLPIVFCVTLVLSACKNNKRNFIK